jgi:hypothetical protein
MLGIHDVEDRPPFANITVISDSVLAVFSSLSIHINTGMGVDFRVFVYNGNAKSIKFVWDTLIC